MSVVARPTPALGSRPRLQGSPSSRSARVVDGDQCGPIQAPDVSDAGEAERHLHFVAQDAQHVGDALLPSGGDGIGPWSADHARPGAEGAVCYTHLTLPTNR